jgi:hypothetical protein
MSQYAFAPGQLGRRMSYAFAIDQTLDKKKLAANVKEVYN